MFEALSVLCRRATERKASPLDLKAALAHIRGWFDGGEVRFLARESERLAGDVLNVIAASEGALNANDALLVVLERDGAIDNVASFDSGFDNVEGFRRISWPRCARDLHECSTAERCRALSERSLAEHQQNLRLQRDSKARTGERTATLRNDPQRSGGRQAVATLRNVAGRDALDDSLDESSRDGRPAPEALVGVVETALAEALRLAAEAERWEIVVQLAEELAARRRRCDAMARNVRHRDRDRAHSRLCR